MKNQLSTGGQKSPVQADLPRNVKLVNIFYNRARSIDIPSHFLLCRLICNGEKGAVNLLVHTTYLALILGRVNEKSILVSLSFSKSCSLVGRVYIPAETAVLTAQLW